MDFLYRSVTPALRRGSASRDCRWCGKAKQNLRSFPTCPSRFSCRHSQRPVLVTMHLDGSMHIKWIIGTAYNANVLHFPTLLGCKLLGKVPMIFFFPQEVSQNSDGDLCPQVLRQLFLYSSNSQKPGRAWAPVCGRRSLHFYNEFPTMEILQSVI